MKYSKLFPMGSEKANDFIDLVSTLGKYNRIEPPSVFPFGQGKALYFGPQGFMVVEKNPKGGQWEVTIEA